MYMDELYKRRIRIVSPPDKLDGRHIQVTDLETGEEITNISSIRIYLQARETSPEIAVSALEQFEEGSYELG